jgi:hypothetical protein
LGDAAVRWRVQKQRKNLPEYPGPGSADFPMTAGAFDTTSNGGSDSFVMK